SSARIKLADGELSYNDLLHKLAGEASDIHAFVDAKPQQLAPTDHFLHINLGFSNGTFTYDGRRVENISLTARGATTATGADLEELNLASPVAKTRLSGKMEDWQALRYNMKFETMLDLTQVGSLLQPGVALSGAGRISGTITGEGAKYGIDAQLDADSLAADNLRLQGVNFRVAGKGEEEKYLAQAQALVKMLNAGGFQINMVQLMGQMMGTGVDFRWLGELQAASVRGGGVTITDLILHDSMMEFKDGKLTATSKSVTSGNGEASGVKINGPHASEVSASVVEGKTNINISRARIESIVMTNGQVSAIEASGIKGETSGDIINLAVDDVKVSGAEASGVVAGSFDIAGAHVAIRKGTVVGTTADVKLGDLKITNPQAKGTVQNVVLSKPVFTIEPSGRYRASADLSLGGGVLGQLQLGSVRSSVAVTGERIEFNNLKAEIANGTLSGGAVIMLDNSSRVSSRLVATFSQIDAAQILALGLGRLAPISGKTNGDLNLNFPRFDVFKSSGVVNARFNGDVGSD
ncbi:MAG: hypothetical protein ACRD63_09455, partial [Pyrinomonadaceae bacterium]